MNDLDSDRMDDRSSARKRKILLGGAAILSWLGFVFHNWWDLPELTPLSPEYSGPTAVFVVVFAAWLWRPASRITRALLLIWAVAHLIGGAIISVIPFDFLPFYPEQSSRHYLGHVVYGLTQIPLIILTSTAGRGRSDRSRKLDQSSSR